MTPEVQEEKRPDWSPEAGLGLASGGLYLGGTVSVRAPERGIRGTHRFLACGFEWMVIPLTGVGKMGR